MQRSSLRTWLLIVSVLFATLVVGGVALTTYVVVSDAMSVEAQDTTVRIASAASQLAKDQAAAARVWAAEQGLEGEVLETEAGREFLRSIPIAFGSAGVREGEFVYYDENMELLWFSDDSAVLPDAAAERALALELRQTTESRIGEGGSLDALFAPANLGVYVVHTPVDVPGGGQGVLDIVYKPDREEATIDAIRLPMATLAFGAMLVMVVIMQITMAWVLRLVDDLREAADSVDAGDLSVRLPAEGDHEIGELGRSLNALLDRLQRRSEAQGRFVADASHELATPVAGIRGYTNILRAWGKDDPEVRDEAISAIDRESGRMARLCSDLLALVRDEREMVFNDERFDINARSREVLAAAATRYIDKNLEFEGPGEGQLMIFSDPDRIEDVVSILVDNAAKYTPDGGTVSVTTRRRRESIIVSVSDTGIGIPPEDVPNIFERFYRSDASRSKQTGGFGLGLPIAKTIVDTAGGTLEVDSIVGEGSTFKVTLPRSRR
jgi:signal transduction histidine kinase